jgi:TM2 domain-containing membrane protein YozV
MRYAYKKWPTRIRWALSIAIYGLCLHPTTSLAAPLAPTFVQHPTAALTTRTHRPLYQRSFDDQFKNLFSSKGRKDPAVSIALAAVPPLLSVQGLGQVYNGEFGKGLLFFGFAQVSLGTYFTAVDNKTANIAFGLYMASWVWSTIDAYRSAKRINAKRGYGNVSPNLNYDHRSIP